MVCLHKPYIYMYVSPSKHSSEANASEFLENLEEMLLVLLMARE